MIRRFDPLGCGFESDPYRVLGVSQGASAAEVKRAYRTLSKQHHPDRNPGCGESCVEKMAALNAAKETIDNRGGGSFEDGDDIAEQWTEILECFSRGGGKQAGKPATRERKPFHKSAGPAGSSEDCSYVCPVGVCDSPSDASKPECTECALCHQRGGSRRKRTKQTSGRSSSSRAKKEQRKAKERRAKERRRAAAKESKKEKRQQKLAKTKDKRVERQQAKMAKPTGASEMTLQPWIELTTEQRIQEITAATVSFWTSAVKQVMDTTPTAKQFPVPVWMWTFFLRKCGVQKGRVGRLAMALAEGADAAGSGEATTLEAFLAFTYEAQVRAMVVARMSYGGMHEDDRSHMFNEVDKALLLKGFRIMQHLKAVLAAVKLDRSTVLRYAQAVAPLLGMNEDDVIPLTDAAKDSWGVLSPRDRVKLDITSAMVAIEGGASTAGGSGSVRSVEEEMASLRSVLGDLDEGLGEL